MSTSKKKYILAIITEKVNTKIGVFDKIGRPILVSNIEHNQESIIDSEKIYSQKNMRVEEIMLWIKCRGIFMNELIAVVSKGGFIRPVRGGVYKITDKMVEHSRNGVLVDHHFNLGCIIAKEIGDKINIPSYIADPVSVDEMEDIARISGIPEINRYSISNALVIKQAVREVCTEIEEDFNESNFIVVDFKKSVCIAAVCNGKIIDVSNSKEEGSFSIFMSGSLPVKEIIRSIFNNEYDFSTVEQKLNEEGGLVSYIGTDNTHNIKDSLEKEHMEKDFLIDAIAYQISKEVGAMATVLKGNVQGVILTGEFNNIESLVQGTRKRIEFIGPLFIKEIDELETLVKSVMRIFKDEEKERRYEEEFKQ